MPVVRGRFTPEVGNTGRSKRFLDVLIWTQGLSGNDLRELDAIEMLREYLRSMRPPVCAIRLLVPDGRAGVDQALTQTGIRFATVRAVEPSANLLQYFGDDVIEEMRVAAATALLCDADIVVVNDPDWFPYIDEFDELGMLLTDLRFLKCQCEIFVRGHDVPWSFASQIWNMTWTGFYQIVEQETFRVGMDFLHRAHRKKANAEALETARTLIHNRLPNLCFTRDRLLFYEIQRLAAVRAKWRRQEFAFEIAYYLNFYYLLLYGGFDHAALMVSQLTGLGLPEHRVGATYDTFLEALRSKAAEIHAVFTNADTLEFIKRMAALRHYVAHRGSLMPAKLVQKPEVEPTDEELDAEIAEAGLDELLQFLPAGELRDSFRETLRFNARVAHYEKGKVVDGVVPIKLNGKFGFIRPHADTDWNFRRFMLFLNSVLNECLKSI